MKQKTLTANAKKKRQQAGGARKPSRASWSGQELSQSNVPALLSMQGILPQCASTKD